MKQRTLQMRAEDQFFEDLDDLRKLEKDLPSRSEMLRRLVSRAKNVVRELTADDLKD